MSPDRIGNTNMWRLSEHEYVAGTGGIIKGPAIVRVHEFDEVDKLLVQAGWEIYFIQLLFLVYMN